MSVIVNEAWGYNQTSGVNFFSTCAGNAPNLGDPAILDRDVADEGWHARAIDDPSTANHDVIIRVMIIWHAGLPSFLLRRPSFDMREAPCDI